MSFTWPLGEAESKLEFFDLSHPWGHGVPAWPYFEDVKIERLHNMARSRVLTQKITTVMHSGTHIDAPAHVVEGTPFLHEIPSPRASPMTVKSRPKASARWARCSRASATR